MDESKEIEIQWIKAEESLAHALKSVLGCSGQLLKNHLDKQRLQRPLKARDTTSLPLELVNHLQINGRYQGAIPRILNETDQYLALHKPPGVHSHPLKYSDTNTLLNYLASINKWEALMINLSQYDRGLIHRLDFETSGVILLAKTPQFFDRMRNDFNAQMKGKYYWAIVSGDFQRSGDWKHYLTPYGPRGASQKVSSDYRDGSVAGELSVQKLDYQRGHSLLLVKLQTGLRHQIRAQLAAIGYPIVGDDLYGGEKGERLFLHALRYQWEDLVEDQAAELFDRFFDLHRALQMGHDMIW